MKRGSITFASQKYSYYFSLLLTVSFLFTVQVNGNPIVPSPDGAQSHKTPQGKQGILEIPKQAATIIRHWVDSSLQTIFNITTPPTKSHVPDELKDSIVGNFFLGNLQATIPPAQPHTPNKPAELTDTRPIFPLITNEESYAGHSQLVERSTLPPAAPAPPPTSPPKQAEPDIQDVTTSKPEVKPSKSPEKVPVLDSSEDNSVSGIYNSYGVHVVTNEKFITTTEQPKAEPTNKVHTLETDAFLSGIYNSYGVPVTKNPDEVYWIPEYHTHPSVIIPIQTSTIPPTTPIPETETETESATESEAIIVEQAAETEAAPVEQATEAEATAAPLETTTDEDEEEGAGVEEAEEAFKRLKSQQNA